MIHAGRLLSTVVAVLSSAACGADHMQDGDVNALGGNIDSARLEVTRHRDAVTAMATLKDLPPELDRYERDMGDIMDTMDTMMGGVMSHCSGSGMDAMHDGMGAVSSEMRSYRDTLNQAATLADARNVCTAHTRRVDGMLDDMQHALGTVGCNMMGR